MYSSLLYEELGRNGIQIQIIKVRREAIQKKKIKRLVVVDVAIIKSIVFGKSKQAYTFSRILSFISQSQNDTYPRKRNFIIILTAQEKKKKSNWNTSFHIILPSFVVCFKGSILFLASSSSSKRHHTIQTIPFQTLSFSSTTLVLS